MGVVVGLMVMLGVPSVRAQSACDPTTQLTYTFTSACPEPIWIGQRSTGDSTAYPPQSGNWALAGTCATNADCPSGACDTSSGACTCASASDCPGGAACGADDKCVTTAVFCMPQSWSSGTFWPRTGCTLDTSVTPASLSCATGQCNGAGSVGLLDCSVGNGAGSPTNPVTQFEVTSTATAVNYDVSLAAGYNVETAATPVGGGAVVPGTTDIAACDTAGCTADLNASCPEALQVLDGSTVIGCLDPCTRCQRADPPSALGCGDLVPDQWTCGVESGTVTTLDLYCAKNFVDGSAQASPNQGVPTAFSQLDCAPGLTFVIPTFATAYSLPVDMGVCLWTTPPQSGIPHFNENGWFDAASTTTMNCGGVPPDYVPLADGTACGGYLTPQSDGGYYEGALGYTCQTATYAVTGGTQVSHLCLPPRTSGLGTCQADTLGNVPLYTAAAGVSNPSWLFTAKQAGGGTTSYYVPFKTACQAAYAWQYDDASAGFGCDPAVVASGGPAFSGFDVTFCGAETPGGGGGGGNGPTPNAVAALSVKGRAAKLDRSGRGVVRIKGLTTLSTTVAIEEATVTLTDLLDEVGAAGELVTDGDELTLTPRKRKKKVAIFETDAGVEPRLKVVLHRPRPDAEKVKVIVIGRRATIAKPTVCTDAVAIETALIVSAGATNTRVGTVGPWQCKPKALHAK
jgi:hypothetical protein